MDDSKYGENQSPGDPHQALLPPVQSSVRRREEAVYVDRSGDE